MQRLATRALRAADRESLRDKDDYALACYGSTFSWLTPAQKEVKAKVEVSLDTTSVHCRKIQQSMLIRTIGPTKRR